MGLWDQVEELEISEEELGNKYLLDKEEAMSLVSKILAFNKEDNNLKRGIFKLDGLIEEDLLKVIGSTTIDIELYSKLKKIKNKLYELNMIKLLEKKSIIGIGGMFSSGKSKFINSVIEEEILPENQLPTTSIPTYIKQGEERLSAYTFNNLKIDLDKEAVNAISHIFYDEYKISFTKFIKSIVIESENYKYDNIVILDTPGYTKSDSHKKQDNTDEQLAREHLKTADYLIWLMDIENGIIVENDLNFIRSLNIKRPVLFVFNKADKKCKSDIKKILSATDEILKNTEINVFAVTAYSSIEKKEYFNTYISDFFSTIGSKENNRADIYNDVKDVLNSYDNYFQINGKALERQRINIYKNINKSFNLNQIIGLATLYSEINSNYLCNNSREKNSKL